jgi:hypothetical protein
MANFQRRTPEDLLKFFVIDGKMRFFEDFGFGAVTIKTIQLLAKINLILRLS